MLGAPFLSADLRDVQLLDVHNILNVFGELRREGPIGNNYNLTLQYKMAEFICMLVFGFHTQLSVMKKINVVQT